MVSPLCLVYEVSLGICAQCSLVADEDVKKSNKQTSMTWNMRGCSSHYERSVSM